jgi:hypothetical protein
MSNIKLSLDLRTSWKSFKHNHKSLYFRLFKWFASWYEQCYSTYLLIHTYCHLVFLCYLGCWITLVAYAKPSWEQFNKSGSTWRLAENLNISNVNHVPWSKGRQGWVRYMRQGKARQGKATRFSHDKYLQWRGTLVFYSLWWIQYLGEGEGSFPFFSNGLPKKKECNNFTLLSHVFHKTYKEWPPHPMKIHIHDNCIP